jgi:hypothetical protein
MNALPARVVQYHWSKIVERSLAVALFCLCEVVSVTFTIQFTLGLALGVVPVAVGVALELAKLCFSLVVVNRLRENRFATAAVASLVALVLATVSAVASVAFFGGAADQQHRRAAVSGRQIERLDRQATQLQQERDLLLQLARQDSEHNYRTRAIEVQRQAAEVGRALDDTNRRLSASLNAAPPAAVLATTPVAQLIERYRVAIALLFAVLLEVLGFASLPLACPRGSRPSPRKRQPAPTPRLRLVPNPESRIEQLSHDAIQLLHAEKIRPTLKDVRDALGVRQVIAQQVIAALVENGALVRDGRRYQIPDRRRALPGQNPVGRGAP